MVSDSIAGIQVVYTQEYPRSRVDIYLPGGVGTPEARTAHGL